MTDIETVRAMAAWIEREREHRVALDRAVVDMDRILDAVSPALQRIEERENCESCAAVHHLHKGAK